MPARDFKGGASAPPYLSRHSGPVLVCGNAFCLRDDFERAREMFPDAPVIAVNGSAAEVRAFALFSLHPSKLPVWIKAQRERFGDGFTTHSSGSVDDKTKLGCNRGAMPWVDYWWQGASGGGTSTWGARKLAALMGFDRVILCGMPLERGVYSNGRMAKHFQQDDVIRHYRDRVASDTSWHPGVVSMSGWTAELLGSPS